MQQSPVWQERKRLKSRRHREQKEAWCWASVLQSGPTAFFVLNGFASSVELVNAFGLQQASGNTLVKLTLLMRGSLTAGQEELHRAREDCGEQMGGRPGQGNKEIIR